MSRSRPRTRRLASLLACVALVSVGCSYTTRQARPPTAVSAQSSMLYAADGSLVRTFHAEENRRDVPLELVPLELRRAVVAIEDERFYRHNGVDVRGIVRAIRTNTEAGEIEEGGSTITQQYVKLQLLRDDSRTVQRKLQEATMALQLEREYSKDKILELYLNAVYFGNGAYGVAAAAQQYFGKQVRDLDLPESALLAGLIQRPNATDPYDHPEEATARRNLVLERMVANHDLTAAAGAQAKEAPLRLAEATTPAAQRYAAPYFVQQIQDWILSDPRFGATKADRTKLLFAGGLRIKTTLDPAAQAAAERAMVEVLPDADKDPDVAIVSIVPATGEVKAMVGGRDFFGTGSAAKLNLATQRRQAGSSFKPFVLAAALAEGMSPRRTYAVPGCIDVPHTTPHYRPCNYDDSEAAASANLIEGTVHSYNTLYVQLMQDVGPEKGVQMARDLGIESPLGAFVSAVLGSNEVTAVDMASAYGTFANHGVHVEPAMVVRVTRADGTVLYDRTPSGRRVLDAGIADTVTAILQQVVQRGTATAARLDRPVAGKTGTADHHHDAWFVGYTPDLVTAVWVGFHRGQIPMEPPNTPINVVGGSYPARIWRAFMAEALAGTPVSAFTPPPAAVFAPPPRAPLDPGVVGPIFGNPEPPGPSGAPDLGDPTFEVPPAAGSPETTLGPIRAVPQR
jgi:penicillin-binding protein 1A